MAGNQVSAVHLQQAYPVTRAVPVHGANDATVVDQAGQPGKDLADFQSALAVLLESKGRFHQDALGVFHLHALGNGLPVVLGKHGFGVEGVHVGGPAIETQVDHPLGLGGKVKSRSGPGLPDKTCPGQQMGQRKQAEPTSQVLQRLATIHGKLPRRQEPAIHYFT